jgi:hypothetical protein
VLGTPWLSAHSRGHAVTEAAPVAHANNLSWSRFGCVSFSKEPYKSSIAYSSTGTEKAMDLIWGGT